MYVIYIAVVVKAAGDDYESISNTVWDHYRQIGHVSSCRRAVDVHIGHFFSDLLDGLICLWGHFWVLIVEDAASDPLPVLCVPSWSGGIAMVFHIGR